MHLIKSGSVSSLQREICRCVIDLSHTELTNTFLHFHTCTESSGCPQCGHASVSLSFHIFWDLPTPHMPVVCLEQKSLYCRDNLVSALPSLGQSTESNVVSIILDLRIQYCFAIGRCTRSYRVFSIFIVSGILLILKNQDLERTSWCLGKFIAHVRNSFAIWSTIMFNWLGRSSCVKGILSSWCPLIWAPDHWVVLVIS